MVDITFWIQISQLGFTVVLTDLPGGDQELIVRLALVRNRACSTQWCQIALPCADDGFGKPRSTPS
ncbi:hypothetical protein, partial [Rhizobium aouanii]